MQYIITSRFANNQAISLINLLVATLISSIIMLIAFNIYILINKQTTIIQQKLNNLYKQHIANFLLRQSIDNAGYKGPISTIYIPQANSINTEFSNYMNIIPKAPLATCIATYNNCQHFVTSKILHKITNKSIKPNTNILLIYDIVNSVTTLSKSMNHPNEALQLVHMDSNINIGDQVIIADYQHIQRFIVSNIYNNYLYHGQPFNNTGFIKNFTPSAEVFKVKHIAFYIAKNNVYGHKYWSLYMEEFSNNSRAEAILENVTNLTIATIDPKINHAIVPIHNTWIFNKYILISIDNIPPIGIAIHNGHV